MAGDGLAGLIQSIKRLGKKPEVKQKSRIKEFVDPTLQIDVSDTSPYQPLKTESKEIRIIHLQPGTWADPISCQLKTVPLSEAHRKFEALSYAWDAEPGFHEILVNGQTCSVKKNLFLALRRLRKSAEPRLIWADALCIDQGSNGEKSHQIALMREIYRACERVYLWLGDYSIDTRTMEDDTKEGPEFAKEDHMSQAFFLIHELALDKHFHELQCYDHNKERNPFDSGIFHAFATLMSSPWWERLWVVQEYVLPPEAIVTCGSISVPWKIFSNAANNSVRHGEECCSRQYARMRAAQQTAMIKLIRRVRGLERTRGSATSWYDFYRTLTYHRNRKASDPRASLCFIVRSELLTLSKISTNNRTILTIYCRRIWYGLSHNSLLFSFMGGSGPVWRFFSSRDGSSSGAPKK